MVGLSTSERREEIRLALGAHVDEVNQHGGYLEWDWYGLGALQNDALAAILTRHWRRRQGQQHQQH